LKAIDQGCLADSRLAGNEEELPLTSERFMEMLL
jgi:hypothetical protein